MPNPPPPIDGIVETILYVKDLRRAVAFYRDVMGLVAMTGDADRFQSFDAGPRQVLLLFREGGTVVPTEVPGGIIPPHDGQGSTHIGFAIGAERYDAWKAHLIEHRVGIESETHWPRGGRSLYFRDPDAHLVELVTPGIWPNY